MILSQISSTGSASSIFQGLTGASEGGLGGGFSSLIASLLGINVTSEGLLSGEVGEGNFELAGMKDLKSLSPSELDKLISFAEKALSEGGAGEQGEALNLIKIEITTVVTELKVFGVNLDSISSTSDLARAYEKMGFDSTVAQAKAERVEAALEMMNRLLGKKSEKSELSEKEDFDLISLLFDERIREVASNEEFQMQIVSQDISVQSITAFQNVNSIMLGGDISESILKGLPLPSEKGVKNLEGLSTSMDVKLKPQLKPQFLEQGQILDSGNDVFPEIDLENTAENLDTATIEDLGEQVERRAVNDARTVTVQETAKSVAPPQTPQVKGLTEEVSTNQNENNVRVKGEKSTKIMDLPSGEAVFTVKPSATQQASIVEVAGQAVDAENFDAMIDEAIEALTQKGEHGAVQKSSQHQSLARQSNVAHQVVMQIRAMAPQGGGQVKMTLNPAELGEVNIQLEITGGKVKGAVVVQSVETAEQLARDLRVLQQGLADAGLELGESGLQFFLNEGQGEAQQSAKDGSSSGGESFEQELLGSEGESSEAEKWIDPDRLVNMQV